MNQLNKQQSGFTLVEIAIVLVIIGLLLGGVLKGQELINSAKVKNIVNDLNGLAAAIYSYQDRYKRLPGDDPGAGPGRWALIRTPGNGDNVLGGNYESTTDADESRLLWAELRLAELVTGPVDSLANAATQPANALGGIVGVQSNGLGLTGLLICSGKLPAKIAQAVDLQLDDGNATTGNVRSLIDGTPPTTIDAKTNAAPTTNYIDNGNNLYVVCRRI